MPYINLQPDEILRSKIKCFWYAEKQFAENEYFSILPDSYIELVFCFCNGITFCREGNGRRILPPSFIVGLLDKSIEISATGMLKTFGIRFLPWAFYELIRKTPKEEISPIPIMFQSLGEQLKTFVCDPEAGLELMRNFCSPLVADGKPMESRVAIASTIIYTNDGLLRIGAIASKAFTSPRHLARMFKKEIGEGPKPYSKKVRFQRIRDRLYEQPESDLTALAYEFGYADQSHFIADFRAFAGKSPAKFARDMSKLRAALTQYNLSQPRIPDQVIDC